MSQLRDNIKRPRHGKMYGARDQGPPEDYTEYQLSRAFEAMWHLQEALGLDEAIRIIWRELPDSMKGEINYSRWTFLAARQSAFRLGEADDGQD